MSGQDGHRYKSAHLPPLEDWWHHRCSSNIGLEQPSSQDVRDRRRRLRIMLTFCVIALIFGLL